MSNKKLKRKLARKVLAGKITVDEARVKLGRKLAQKAAGRPVVTKSAAAPAVTAGSNHALKTIARLEKSAQNADPEKKLLDAVRLGTRAAIAETFPDLPMPQDSNPYAPAYKAATPDISKARKRDVYKGETRTAFLNSPDPATRAVAEKLWKTPFELSAEECAAAFFHDRAKYSDNPAEREAAFKRENPDKAPTEQHVMVSAADGILRDAGTGEPVKIGSKLPDPGPDLFGADGRGITAGLLNDQLTYVNGGGYAPGYERTFEGLR